MAWQVTVYTVPLVLSTFLGIAVTAVVWRERPKSGATWLALAAIAITLWALGEAVVFSTTAEGTQLLGNRLALVGVLSVPSTFMVFTLKYTGRFDGVPAPVVWLVVAEPVAVGALALLGHPSLDPARLLVLGPDGFLDVFGPDLLTAHYVFGNALLFANEYLLLRHFLVSRNVFRKRTFFLLALLGTLHACHLVTVFGLSPTPSLTLTPLGFLLFGSLSLVTLVSYRNLSFLPLDRLLAPFRGRAASLAPLARDRAIEEMEPGFIVVDHAGHVVDTNPIGKRMLGREDERIVGKQLSDVVELDMFVDGPPESLHTDPGEVVDAREDAIWVESADGQRRCFDVTVTTLTDDGEARGYVVLVHDVTEGERRKQTLERRTRELERQNEQLEEFAGLVSHDLRNPLNVAGGRLEMVDAGDDQEHVEHARNALDRMEAIIDDVLTVARVGRTIDETERLDVGDLARTAWANVDTREADLVVEIDLDVDADRNRLLNVFENLFRNSIEHGGSDVTVTVGSLPDGFYVADDGPGIPEDKREDVLEHGYSTNREGTGFGLSIVRTIVQAHGWEITATVGEEGGARFEITRAGTGEGVDDVVSLD